MTNHGTDLLVMPEDVIRGFQNDNIQITEASQPRIDGVRLNLIAKDKWIEHYRELLNDPNVPQEDAEDKRGHWCRFSNI